MYFSSDSGGAFHTWRQRFPDGQPEQITSGPTEEEGLAMAPDGRSFITAVGLTQSSVWVHDDGGDRQVSLEGYALAPKFTPDGKRLLVSWHNFELDSALLSVSLDGNAAVLLKSSNPEVWHAVPSPNGRMLAIAEAGGPKNVWQVENF